MNSVRPRRNPWLTAFAVFLMIYAGLLFLMLLLFACGIPISLELDHQPFVWTWKLGLTAMACCALEFVCGYAIFRRKRWGVQLYFGLWVVSTLLVLISGRGNLDLTPVLLLCILWLGNERLS